MCAHFDRRFPGVTALQAAFRTRTGSSRPRSGCSTDFPEDIDGAVRAPLLDRQWGLVPKTRALSHLLRGFFREKVDYSNLNHGPGRGHDSRFLRATPPAIPIAPLQPTSLYHRCMVSSDEGCMSLDAGGQVSRSSVRA
jgi:hypothetical protein